MHPIWFAIWAWEKAWSPDGLFPLLEHNQGALSVAALMLALYGFWHETRRANAAVEASRASDAAQDRRALEASQHADRRMAEANAEADRKAQQANAAADRKAAEQAHRAAIDERRTFIRIVEELVRGVERVANDDLAVLARFRDATNDRDRAVPTGWQRAAAEAKAALEAILPSSPRDPGIILGTQRIILALGEAQTGYAYQAASALISLISNRIDGVKLCTAQLSALKPEHITPPPVRKRGAKAGSPQ